MPNPATPVYYYAGLSGLGSITCKLYAVDPIAAQAVADTITLTELTDAASNGIGIYEATSSAGLAGLYWAVLTGGMVDGGFVEMVASTNICVIQAGKFDWDTNNKASVIAGKLPANNIADETLLLAAIGDPFQAGTAVTLAASQPNYAPSKAGDAMTLTSAYDAAKTAASSAAVAAIAAVLSGITSLANWLRLTLCNSAPDATALAEVNTSGGTYDATKMSQQAMSLTGVPVIHAGTAQAGTTGSITLDAGASAVDNLYQWEFIVLTGGTGAGQTRQMSSYAGSTKVATVDPSWTVAPDNTSTFDVLPNIQVSSGSLVGPGSLSKTLTIYQPGGIVPAANVRVWISTDVAGINVIAGTLSTNDLGQVTFMLDAGVYYAWADSSQINFTNPSTISVP